MPRQPGPMCRARAVLAVLALVIAACAADPPDTLRTVRTAAYVHAEASTPEPAPLTAADVHVSTPAAQIGEAVQRALLERWYSTPWPQPQTQPVTKRRATPAPASTPDAAQADAPPDPSPAYADDSVEALIHRLFDPVGQGSKAVGVAWCESRLNPESVSSGGGNWGLFQINSVHKRDFEATTGRPWEAVLEAGPNARYARHLYDDQGWRPWACRGAAPR